MEKIKRSNNLWTSDSLFLRPTLSIPIDKSPMNGENSLNVKNELESNGQNHHLDRSLNSSSDRSSDYLNGSVLSNADHSLLNTSNSSTLSSNSAASNSTKEHNNNLDYKISLNEIQPEINIKEDQPSTSSGHYETQTNGKMNSNEMLKARDESMDDFLSRIDQYIKQSKVKMDSFANTSEIIISSKSDDNIFQHLHNYNSKSINYRQHSLRNSEILSNDLRDKSHNHENKEIIYSLRKLEKEQEEREKYEL